MAGPDVFAPAQLGPVTLRNRTVKAATFEGRTPQGQVTDDLIEFHSGFARGGIGLTTVAYLAVAPEGRTHAEQIVVGESTLAGLSRLADAVHDAGASIAGQVGHAGPVANGRSNGARALSASRMPSPLSMQMIGSAERARPDPDHPGVRRHRPDAGARRLRRTRAAHGAQLPDLLLPRSRPQPAPRPMGRLAGEPRPARPAGRPGGARGGRVGGRGHREGEPRGRLQGRRDHRRGDRVRPAAGGATATSTPCR